MDSDTDADADPDTDDPDTLRERVADLEATVAAQQQTIRKLLPSRRRVLQAGGVLAGGGALGALSADRASADVVGQVGTDADRVDVFAGQVDANSVNTEQADTRTGYTEVSSSRSFNTTETNNTGADLDVSVVAISDSSDTDMNIDIRQGGLVVDKTRIPSAANAERASVQATIPAGSDYTVRAFKDLADYSIDTWVEQS